MADGEHVETARGLLEGLNFDGFREVGVEALRKWRAREKTWDHFTLHGDLGTEAVPLLASTKGTRVNDLWKVSEASFGSGMAVPWMRAVLDFMSWLARSGLAIPMHYGGSVGLPTAYHLTSAGQHLVETPGDHPFLPGFVARVVGGYPDLPDEVRDHLVDARACLDHGLGRPSVSLLGLAYEAAEDAAIEYLETAGKLRVPSGANAAKKISAVKAAIPKLINDLEQRGAAAAAWDFADHLRARRQPSIAPEGVPRLLRSDGGARVHRVHRPAPPRSLVGTRLIATAGLARQVNPVGEPGPRAHAVDDRATPVRHCPASPAWDGGQSRGHGDGTNGADSGRSGDRGSVRRIISL